MVIFFKLPKVGKISYYSYATYLRKCQEANILPMFHKFLLNDLVLFHQVSYENIPLRMPSYLTIFNGISRLRPCQGFLIQIKKNPNQNE